MTNIAEARRAFAAGDSQRAVELGRAAIAEARTGEQIDQLAQVLDFVGGVLLSRSQYPEAMSCFIESEELWRRLDQPAMVVACLHSIGQIDTHVGNFAESAEAYAAALKLASDLGPETRAPLLQRMGMLYARLGDFARAQQFHEEAAAHHQSAGDQAAQASSLNSIGTLHLRLAEERRLSDPDKASCAFATAQSYFEQAAQLAGETTDRHLQGLIAGNIGSVLARLGRIDQALPLMEKQLEIVQAAGDRYNESLCLANIGEALRLSGKAAEAVDLLQRSLAVGESINSIARQRRAHEELSRCFEDLDEFQLALFHFKHCDAFKDAMHSEQNERRTRDLQVQVAVNEVRLQADKFRAERDRLALLNERLHDQAYRDPLTGLANRRRLDQGLLDLYARAVEDDTHLAIALADIDHFKNINDRYSHAVGDQVLQRVATLLTSAVRGEDLVVRYGGEEFALVLKGLEINRALMACERVRTAVEGFPWGELHPELRVTLSIGVTADLALGSGVAMLEVADQNLYKAKHAGRNQVAH